MGVLRCDRRGCENIMCDRLILNRTRYICERCYAELCAAKERWPAEMTAYTVRHRIEVFMETDVGSAVVLPAPEVEEEFARLTGGAS